MMVLYTLKLAWRSVVATPWLSAVTVVGIALGIAVPTTLLSVRHVFASDPIPHKSDRLFNVRVDNWDPSSQFFDVLPGDPPKHITYRDMTGLMESDIPEGQTGIASATIFVFPDEAAQRPYQAVVRLCHADFFGMLDVPFRYGSGWSADADVDRRQVAVLSQRTNDRLFGGRDSVGETVRLGDREFTVVGVLDHYRPLPQFYDVINNAFGDVRDVFVPFDLIRDEALGLNQIGDTDGWGSFDFPDRDAILTQAEFNWIQFWVELDPGAVANYRDWVDGYALEQKKLGRFPKPLNNRISPLMEWMRIREVVPDEVNALIGIAFLFLLVCCLNLLGLLLAKFLARSDVLGVHRALGASRTSAFLQRLAECGVIGVFGGVVGAGLAAVALRVLDRSVPDRIMADGVLVTDGFMLAVAVALAVSAALLSGMYPAWRACRVAPAMQLKIN
jgi:putative ABC transport system permease protein